MSVGYKCEEEKKNVGKFNSFIPYQGNEVKFSDEITFSF